jgi:NADH dehydrogenase/NADH:ubiquinone oxidoreductase subunit G
VWYLKNTPSVCAGCARGCNVLVSTGQQQSQMTFAEQIDDRIKRIVPRFNEAVNGHWMCDVGRLSYQRLDAAPRLVQAEAPAGTRCEWDAGRDARRGLFASRGGGGEGRGAAVLRD